VLSDQLERETKYDAPADYVLPPLDGIDGADDDRVRAQTTRMDSVYFDTADHDLIARGITLRCRTGEADNGWQLKAPLVTPGLRSDSLPRAATLPSLGNSLPSLPVSSEGTASGTRGSIQWSPRPSIVLIPTVNLLRAPRRPAAGHVHERRRARRIVF
jgi:hypothetical protein